MEAMFRSNQRRGTLRRVAGWVCLPEKQEIIVLFQDAAGRIVPGPRLAVKPVLEKDWDDSVLFDDEEEDFVDGDLLDDDEDDEDLFEEDDDFEDDFDDEDEEDDFEDDDYDEELDEDADEEDF